MAKAKEEKKIVLIDPATQIIKKVYNTKEEICNDLNITNTHPLNRCLRHLLNSVNKYIIKYECDATPENIKIWCEKFDGGRYKKIVIIDPKTKQVIKTYLSRYDLCTDFNIIDMDALCRCLRDEQISYDGKLIKYEGDVTPENIKIWCEKFEKCYNKKKILVIDSDNSKPKKKRKSINSNKKIVLIDHLTKSITKIYDSKDEICSELNITVFALNTCLRNETNTCNYKYILKYQNEATVDNIKVWTDKFIADYGGKIVLIDPIKKTIHKTYISKQEACTDLKIKCCSDIVKCLNNKTTSYSGYVLKRHEEATIGNILLWSNLAIYGINGEKKCTSCNEWFTVEFNRYCEICIQTGDYDVKIKDKKIALINPVTKTIYKVYNSINEVTNDLNIDDISSIIACLKDKIIKTTSGFILKLHEESTKENIIIWTKPSPGLRGINGEQKCQGCDDWIMKKGYCKPCQLIANKKWTESKISYFKHLCNSLRANAKKRKNKGRIDAGIITIDHEYLISLFDEQKGLCYYSGLPLVCAPLSNWQCSVERLDNSKGYIPGNIKLICLEFNIGYGQWSKENIMIIKQLQQKKTLFNKLKKEVENARTVQNKMTTHPPRPKPIETNGNILYYCNNCCEYLDKSSFQLIEKTSVASYCKPCRKIETDNYANTIRGFIIKALGAARGHVKKIKENINRSNENSKFELTLDIILDKILEQKGRCYYSNIELIFKPKSKYMASLERLDSKKGYTIENTVLICVEFNSSDRSSISTTSTGSGQWSKEKFDHLMKNFNFNL